MHLFPVFFTRGFDSYYSIMNITFLFRFKDSKTVEVKKVRVRSKLKMFVMILRVPNSMLVIIPKSIEFYTIDMCINDHWPKQSIVIQSNPYQTKSKWNKQSFVLFMIPTRNSTGINYQISEQWINSSRLRIQPTCMDMVGASLACQSLASLGLFSTEMGYWKSNMTVHCSLSSQQYGLIRWWMMNDDEGDYDVTHKQPPIDAKNFWMWFRHSLGNKKKLTKCMERMFSQSEFAFLSEWSKHGRKHSILPRNPN